MTTSYREGVALNDDQCIGLYEPRCFSEHQKSLMSNAEIFARFSGLRGGSKCMYNTAQEPSAC